LEFPLPDGSRRRVALTGLGDETARLAVAGGGGEDGEFPITEIDKVWEGAFILPWKPPAGARPVAPGASGEAVRWVRRALDRIEGAAEKADVSDKFDDELKRRVMAFQRQRLLAPDGVVGRDTLFGLALALDDATAPRLSRREHQGAAENRKLEIGK